MASKLGRIARSVVVLWAIASCGDGRKLPDPEFSVRRDSAGIRLIENRAPRWQPDEGWRVDSIPALVIGATDHLGVASTGPPESATQVHLERVQGVGMLPGGRVVVGDDGPKHVMVFDEKGALETTMGGKGEGPGELSAILDVYTCGRDSVVVASRFDLLVYDAEGTFVRQAAYRAPGEGTALRGISGACDKTLLQERSGQPQLGDLGPTMARFVWAEPGAERVEAVAETRLIDVWMRELYGSERSFVIPWGASPETHAVRGSDLWIGYGRAPELRRYDRDGTLTSIIRWQQEPSRVTAADRGEYARLRARWLADMPDDPESRYLFPALDEYPDLPTEKPIFDRVLIDDEDRLWVRAFASGSFGIFDRRLPDPPSPDQEWMLFDSTGEWLGGVRFPPRFDLRVVAEGRAIGIHEDAFGVQTVQVLPLRQPPSPRDR